MTQSSQPQATGYFWPWVLCLLGLDYFSTLAYQPSITFAVAGRLGPLATALVVLATLLGALPVYCYLAGRSPTGKGSLGLLERFVRGWRGKTLVLVLLGFAATDFTMLKTLSLADAAVHLLQNPHPVWRDHFHNLVDGLQHQLRHVLDETYCAKCNDQLVATLLIGFVSFIFWFVLRRGFNRNVIVLAVPVVALYLILTGMILGGGVWHLVQHPELLEGYRAAIVEGDWALANPYDPGLGWLPIAGLSLLLLPKLALGLSGFEMSMILMPQVRGKDTAARVRATRWVLILAALIMSVLLLASSLVATIFIPPAEFAPQGQAMNRALAYLAHGQPLTEAHVTLLPFCGPWFGSLYDISTVLLLAFAGTSVMTALAALLPQFMSRFGMEFRWSQRWGLLLIAFALINIVITVHFQASVDEQRNAYATGVLALIVGACVASYLDSRHLWRADGGFLRGLRTVYLLAVTLGFAVTFLAVLIHSGGGLAISGLFIAAILGMSVLSRAIRADETRTIGFAFKDDNSKLLWDTLRVADFPILIPHRPGREPRDDKETQIRREHNLADDADLVFLEIELDDPSDFFQQLHVEVLREDLRFIIRITGSVSVAHAIATVAMEMSRYSQPPGLHFGWPELDLLSASWSYLAFGEGNIPWKVRELIQRAERDPTKRPRVIVG